MTDIKDNSLALTILMPCLNEEQTIGACIEDAFAFLKRQQINGEVLIVDNGSTDASARIAVQKQARVVHESKTGYGYALRCGLSQAKGKWIIMGDCDQTYDFGSLDEFVNALQEGTDVVIGNRFAHADSKRAMSFSHYVGVKGLSWLGNRIYRTKVSDFHCGLRGISQEAVRGLCFTSSGMEFATEMIAKAAQMGLRIDNVPVRLSPCPVKRKSHLRTIPDGLRHVRYMMRGNRK